MARKIGEAFLRVRPDTSGFAKDAQPGMVDAGNRGGAAFGGAFKGALKGVALAVGALVAGQAVIGFISDATREAREAAKVGRLTEAVIKSTGGAARVSAKDVGELAEQLSELVGVDDEAIQGAENLLLTFTNIKNAAGKGNQIFNEATKAIVDMTAAMNNGEVTEENLRSTTIQVGKALNDPIKGITALRKVGVTFTADQIKQIEALVKSGKTMEAQKIILAELNKEFGGAAAAAADPAQRASVAWSNFKEVLGNFVLPVLGQLADVFTNRIVPVLQTKVLPVLARVAAWMQGTLVPAIRDHVVPALQQFGRWVGDEVVPRLQALWSYLKTNVLPILQDLVVRGFGGAREAVAGLREAFAENRDELMQLWNGFKTVVDFIVQKVLPVLGPIFTNSIRASIYMIQAMIAWVGFLVRAFNTIKDAVIAAKNWIVNTFGDVVTFFRGLPGRIVGAIGNLRDLLVNAGKDIIVGLWNGIKSLSGWLAERVRGFIRDNVPGPVRKLLGISSPSKLFEGYGGDTVRGYIRGWQAALPELSRLGGGLVAGAGGAVALARPAAAAPTNVTVVIDGRAIDPSLIRVIRSNPNLIADANAQGTVNNSRRG